MREVEEYLNTVHCMDCLEFMKTLPDNCVDSIVTDPPYHLVSIVKRFGGKNSAPAKEGEDGSFKRLSGGFMGKTWDGVDENGIGIAQSVEMWAECLRILKPGGHLLAFSGTRTYHRMASAIEDAGFEVRDMIEWVYGSGFPKSLNIGKAVDKLQGNEREGIGTYAENSIDGAKRTKNPDIRQVNYGASDVWDKQQTKGTSEWEGWGTALKPAHEPICMARKPLAEKNVAENCLKYGTGGINIDESRVEYISEKDKKEGQSARPSKTSNANEYALNHGGLEGMDRSDRSDITGRFPANLIHDNSEEVRECFPETGSVKGRQTQYSESDFAGDGGWKGEGIGQRTYDGSGNASRFFKSILYYPKASKGERDKGCEHFEIKRPDTRTSSGMGSFEQKGVLPGRNHHPTVKPIALMEYLIKMVTRKGGIVFDPFAGSGTTLVAAKKNGYKYLGTEMTDEYIPIIEARLGATPKDTGKLFDNM